MTHHATRKLDAFTYVSLDGYYCDAAGDMGFAHKLKEDAEWNDFVAENAARESVLLFGRVTYQMMAAWWPTPAAKRAMPAVARRMNASPKVVFSRTLSGAEWNNTVIERDLVPSVRRLKGEPGPDLVILGSGSIVAQLLDAGLLDTHQVVINPIALGSGKSPFAGLSHPRTLSLTGSRSFRNGAVALQYRVLA